MGLIGILHADRYMKCNLSTACTTLQPILSKYFIRNSLFLHHHRGTDTLLQLFTTNDNLKPPIQAMIGLGYILFYHQHHHVP